MSVKIMSAVWENEELDPYERLVLLSLADHSDDQGYCYPSIRRLCSRTGMKERGVQNVCKRLSEKGYLTIQHNAGRSGSNLYRVAPTPAPDAPPHGVHPAPDAPHPPHPITSTPAPDAPKPSGTVKEPSGKSAGAEVRDHLCKWASPDAVTSFVRYRQKKGKALTPVAAKRQASQLQKIAEANMDPDDALGMAEERGWQSVQADWYFNAVSQRDNRPNLKSIPGGRHDRRQFDQAHREYTRRLAAGEINRGPDPSDPFAGG